MSDPASNHQSMDTLERWQQIMMQTDPTLKEEPLVSPHLKSYTLPPSLDIVTLTSAVLEAPVASAAEPVKRKRGRPPSDKPKKEAKKPAQPQQKDGESTEKQAVNPRRVTHNVIERRYRNNLNSRIAELRDAIPALNSGKKVENVDDGEDDEEEGGNAGGNPGAQRLNKGTILSKATEYIKELEEQVKIMEKLKSAVVDRFGDDGSEFMREFLASIPASTSTSTSNPPATSPPASATASPPVAKKQKTTAAVSKEAEKKLAGDIGSGIALMQQQQQQIQQWLAIQQQYQVAAAVAAAASVEAYKNLTSASSSTASPPATTPEAMLSPTSRSTLEKVSSVSPTAILSPDNPFGFSITNPTPEANMSSLLTQSIMDPNMTNYLTQNLDYGSNDMLTDLALPPTSNDASNSDSMFSYLLFGAESTSEQTSSGMRLFAMMFMVSSVFYVPHPFDMHGSEDSALRNHVAGRLLSTRSYQNGTDSLRLILAGLEIPAALTVAAAACWWILKGVVVLFGISQVILCVRNLVLRESVEKKTEKSEVSAVGQLKQLTRNTVFPSSVSGSTGIAGVAMELTRFLMCYVLGFGSSIDAILSMGRSDETKKWHAIVARTGGRALDSLVESQCSANQVISTSLLTLSHASMAGSAISPSEMAKLKLTCSLALQHSTNSHSETFYTRAVSSFAMWLLSDALSQIQGLLVSTPTLSSQFPLWILESCTPSTPSTYWTQDAVFSVFESFVSPSSSKGTTLLQKFTHSETTNQIQFLFAVHSKSILASSTSTTTMSLETTAKFLNIYQTSLTTSCLSTAFAASSFAIMSCWKQRISPPEALIQQWQNLLLINSTTSSLLVTRIALLVVGLIKADESRGLAESLSKLDQLMKSKIDGDDLMQCLEFAALSWVVESLESLEEQRETQVKVLARMRRLLPVVGKQDGMSGGAVDCLVGWMSVMSC